jgi:type IV pilus assembly protein PilF
LRLLAILFLGTILAACTTVKDGPKPDLDKAAASRVAAGMEYLRQGKPMEAQRHLTRAIELNDDSPEAHNALALLYRYQGDIDREERHLKKALSADSDYGPARLNYGTLLLRQGDTEKALREFERAADNISYDGRGMAYANAGMALVSLGRAEEAKNAFNRALRLNPQAITPKLEMAHLMFDENDMRAAQFYYDQYVASVDQQSPRGLWLGIRIADQGGQADRKASYELALEKLYPQSPEYRAWKEWKAEGGQS